METESPVTTDKASKRIVDQAGDIEMEEPRINKKARIQDPEEEEVFVTKLVETGPEQLGFQVILEDPPPATTSSSAEVTVPDTEEGVVATRSSWPIEMAIEENNRKVMEKMQ